MRPGCIATKFYERTRRHKAKYGLSKDDLRFRKHFKGLPQEYRNDTMVSTRFLPIMQTMSWNSNKGF
jgi:hypothetical protein